MQVGFHEPGEGFEVDEGDRGGWRWVREEGLHATSFLAVAGYGAGGVEEGFCSTVCSDCLLRET